MECDQVRGEPWRRKVRDLDDSPQLPPSPAGATQPPTFGHDLAVLGWLATLGLARYSMLDPHGARPARKEQHHPAVRSYASSRPTLPSTWRSPNNADSAAHDLTALTLARARASTPHLGIGDRAGRAADGSGAQWRYLAPPYLTSAGKSGQPSRANELAAPGPPRTTERPSAELLRSHRGLGRSRAAVGDDGRTGRFCSATRHLRDCPRSRRGRAVGS